MAGITKRARDLRALRIEKALTQAEVARKWGVSQTYYSSVELGKKPKEISDAIILVGNMRSRANHRTGGGPKKVGRAKT